MNIQELKDKIKSGAIGGAYIFAGEEDYLKKFYASELAKIASPEPSFDIFNHVMFDGETVDFASIKEAVSSPPMFSDYKLIEWRYASFDSMKESELKQLLELADYIKNYPYAALVFIATSEGFSAGTVKRPSRLASRLKGAFSLVNFEKSTDAQLMGWLKKHFDSRGIKVTASALSALIFRSGHGMDVLRGEVEKLSAYLKANSIDTLTEAEVTLVASSTLECDAFALSSAVTDKNREAAYVAILDMKMRRIEPAVVLATLTRAFSELVIVSLLLDEGKRASDIEAYLKWNPYKIKISINAARAWGTKRLTEATSRLRSLDAASKSNGTSGAGFGMVERFIAEYL